VNDDSGWRVCAVCLTSVLRDKYTQHIEDVHGYETIEIKPIGDVIQKAEYTYVESDWIVIADGIEGAAYEYNRKTGETRPYQDDHE
jgi:hypothetical protein